MKNGHIRLAGYIRANWSDKSKRRFVYRDCLPLAKSIYIDLGLFEIYFILGTP